MGTSSCRKGRNGVGKRGARRASFSSGLRRERESNRKGASSLMRTLWLRMSTEGSLNEMQSGDAIRRTRRPLWGRKSKTSLLLICSKPAATQAAGRRPSPGGTSTCQRFIGRKGKHANTGQRQPAASPSAGGKKQRAAASDGEGSNPRLRSRWPSPRCSRI